MGRKTSYDEDTARRICEALAVKGSLRRVCAEDDSLPTDSTVRRWLATGQHMLDGESFVTAYARAKEAGIDALVDETLDISDDGSNDWMEVTGRKGESLGWQINGEAVQRSKIRVETRRWLAERMAPKKYGVRSATEISGPGGGPVKQQVIVATGVPSADDIA